MGTVFLFGTQAEEIPVSEQVKLWREYIDAYRELIPAAAADPDGAEAKRLVTYCETKPQTLYGLPPASRFPAFVGSRPALACYMFGSPRARMGWPA
jgi:hypothetical protein